MVRKRKDKKLSPEFEQIWNLRREVDQLRQELRTAVRRLSAQDVPMTAMQMLEAVRSEIFSLQHRAEVAEIKLLDLAKKNAASRP